MILRSLHNKRIDHVKGGEGNLITLHYKTAEKVGGLGGKWAEASERQKKQSRPLIKFQNNPTQRDGETSREREEEDER